MIDVRSYVWLIDLDGTMNDDRDRMAAYAGDPGSSESWTEYHDHWLSDPFSREMLHFANLIPETDWLFFVSLRHSTHWQDTREELQWRLRRLRFGLFLYDGKKSKEEAWQDDVEQISSMVGRMGRMNTDIRHAGSFLVDDSDWRLSKLRDNQSFFDVVHMKVALPGREDV